MRGGDDDAVGEAIRPSPVVYKDGARNDRSRREAVIALNECLYTIPGEHFERDAFGGSGKGVGVFAHEQRPSDSLVAPVFADCLGDGEDVRFCECRVRAAAAMAAGAEADELVRVGQIGLGFVERGFEPAHVDQEVSWCGFACKRVCAHGRGLRANDVRGHYAGNRRLSRCPSCKTAPNFTFVFGK